MSVIQTLVASRNATWAPTLAFTYSGDALPSIDHIALQVRLYPGAAGAPLLFCNPIAYTDVDNGDGTRTLTLSPVITPEGLSALPGLNIPEAGDSQTFSFDIRISYGDGITEILSAGSFIVFPGVTTV